MAKKPGSKKGGREDTFNLTDPEASKQVMFDRQEQIAEDFVRYVEASGLKSGFELIFAEIIEKGVPHDQIYPYAIARLRQLAKEIRAN